MAFRLEDPKFQHLVRHLHSLGVRPLAEFLITVAADGGFLSEVAIGDTLGDYSRISPVAVATLGADDFPPFPPTPVPDAGA